MSLIEKLGPAALLIAFLGMSIWAGITDHRQDPDTTVVLS